ncbi:MAG TPA: universal stress protein [Gemmatimonadales bacterium]
MTWAQLLAASDDSLAGLHAIRVSQVLARTLGAGHSVMTVLSSPDRQVPEALIPYRPRVAVGHPGIEIVRAAEQIGADLIVIGRSVRASHGCPRLGTTADSVVRRSNRPCLMIPLGQDRLDHAVVALDGSERGLMVLGCAQEFIRARGGDLEAIHVEPLVRRGNGESASQKSLRILDALGEGRGGNGRAWPLRVLHGDPAECLCGELQGAERDLLVVGARRGGPGGIPESTGVGRTLLYTAPCAVLTVPL